MSDRYLVANTEPLFGEVISAYTQDQAIEDGVLVLVGHVGEERVVFTSNLFAEGYEDEVKRKALVQRGLGMLKIPDSEDSRSMRLRIIEEGKIWVIQSADEGVTFLKPEDY